MRENVMQRYSNAIQGFIDNQTVIDFDDFTKVSREYFKNFVTIHYLRKAECLNEVSKRKFMFRTDIPIPVMIKRYSAIQSAVGAAATKRQRQKRLKEKKHLLNGRTKTKESQPMIAFHDEDRYIHNEQDFLSSLSDAELVAELRKRGFEVRAIKMMEL